MAPRGKNMASPLDEQRLGGSVTEEYGGLVTLGGDGGVRRHAIPPSPHHPAPPP